MVASEVLEQLDDAGEELVAALTEYVERLELGDAFAEAGGSLDGVRTVADTSALHTPSQLTDSQ